MSHATRTVRARKAARPQGLVLYRGPSLLTGSPIVCIATGLSRKSKNPKTGQMVQTYILANAGENPMVAVKTGGDRSVCGDCVHRGTTCYVNVVQAPLSVYRAYKRGLYPTFHPPLHLHHFEGRFLRLGSYGDPAAVPLYIWRLLCRAAGAWTGYTHQWRTCSREYARYCMASVETVCQREQALALGYRTFRVRLADQPVEPGEFVCPASAEAGRRLTCEECGACSGAKDSPQAVSPAIVFHGADIAKNWRYRHFARTMEWLHAEEARFSLPIA